MIMKIRKHAALFLALMIAIVTVFPTSVVNAADDSQTTEEAKEAGYGNFRNVQAGAIGDYNLYRSQHPANGSWRSQFANSLAEEKGIRTVLNLSDSDRKLKNYFKKNDITSSYYYKELYDNGCVYTAGLSVSHNSSTYPRKVAEALRFLAKNRGPYLVHCEVGRDRTGLVILLLECLMNVPYSYMVNDYAQSYINVSDYSVEKAVQKATKQVGRELSYISGKNKQTDWNKTDLVRSAQTYLRKGGMTTSEISALKRALAVSYPKPAPSEPPASPPLPDDAPFTIITEGGNNSLSRTSK